MEKLFDTTEFFQKERPTEPTKSQVEEFYKKMAKEIKKEKFSSSEESEIIEDLKDLFPFSDSGFEMAKELDGYTANAEYDIDSSFIDWLEDLQWEYRKLNDVNVKEWVKCHNPLPMFQKGQKLEIMEKLCYQKDVGKIVYVNGFQEDKANYLIDEDPNRQGGTILPYELVESRCLKADA